VEERLTAEQCRELFQRLFPNGLDDPSLVPNLAPEGWEHSPLALIYHPTAEQRYEETLRLCENLRRLSRSPVSEEEPHITLDTIRREIPVEASNPREECADLMGCCLWDIFSDNHEVRTADALVDLGTFRAAAGFIANVRHQSSNSDAGFATRSDYLDFYMGTSMVRHRADLTPAYELIFRRMRQLGLDWRYVHPRLMAVDLRPLQEASENEQVAEAVRYNPTENFWREQKDAERDAELAELRQNLDEAYRESVEETRNAPPPATVSAYRRVYRRFPAGWPPSSRERER